MSTTCRSTAGPPEPWDSALYAEAIGGWEADLTLRDGEGWCLTLDVGRWWQRADVGDQSVVERCAGQVLDIGCGAGRLVEALALRGHEVLGIDVCHSAVVATVCRGGAARRGSVFDPIPEEGGWDSALLIDGNIGIGGDPRVLLRRIRNLVRDSGLLIVETATANVDERRRVRIYVGQKAASPVFSWAILGARALIRHAESTGWTAAEQWGTTSPERHFVALRARA